MNAQSAEKDAPTTDCPVCGRSAKDCNDSHAKGWDGCCMACDEVGRLAAHRLRVAWWDAEQWPVDRRNNEQGNAA